MTETVTVVGRDNLSQIAKCEFDNGAVMFYRLTNCHNASAKGSIAIDGEGVTVCRACYEEIDPEMGMAWDSADHLIKWVPEAAEWSL